MPKASRNQDPPRSGLQLPETIREFTDGAVRVGPNTAIYGLITIFSGLGFIFHGSGLAAISYGCGMSILWEAGKWSGLLRKEREAKSKLMLETKARYHRLKELDSDSSGSSSSNGNRT